jgi:acyl-CoA synthetase (AMP-forming)/AMP-acid ligase II
MLIAVPLFGTLGQAAFQAALALRATVVLQPRFEPAEIARLAIATDTDVLVVVPVMLEMLLESGVPLTRLRVVLSGGSALPGDLATRFMDAYGDVLYNIYGSTEASCISIARPMDLRRAPDTAGRPPYGTVVAIVDEAARQVPPGTVGRICVRNTILIDGYTSGAKVTMHDGLLATGDLGHLGRDGLLFIDGRGDDMIISGGENVFPQPVEDILGLLPQVREAAVVGVADATFGQALAAFIVLRDGQRLDAERVRAHVRQHLPRSSVPRDVTFIRTMPRNAAGKVVARELVAGDDAK